MSAPAQSSAARAGSAGATGPTPTAAAAANAKSGALAASVCYLLWGLVPIYWKQLHGIDARELIAHRQVWSLVFVLGVVAVQGGMSDIRRAFATLASIGINFLSAILLTLNWLIYVWAVNEGHIIECSLGYFLVPLVNVAAGRWILHEHLRRLQWLAIACAAAGVVWMIWQLDHPPWIALSLAATWGAYSLLKKKSALGSLSGLTVETLLLAPLAIGFLLWRNHTGAGALGRADAWTHTLILGSGIITAIPLLLFAYGAQRIRLSTLGLLQYIAPSVQFTIGLWLYHEPFSRARAASFAVIWAGLALYTADNLLAQRNPPRAR